MIKWFKSLVLASAVGVLSACGSDDPSPVNIVETAKSDPSFSILVEAITVAGLADTLAGPGPFTVFAPTNEGFAALLKELGVTKDQLFADKALLTKVLTYHALSGSVKKADVPAGKAIKTIEGGIFKIDPVGSDLVITDGRNRTSKIIATDIVASNGVIHAIDKVILPANKTIVETAIASNPEFSILVEAVVKAGLADALSGPGPFTVFAPTNAAFAGLLAELNLTKDQLLNSPLLADVLKYHVVGSRVLKAEVPIGTPITTLQGEPFTVNSALAIIDRNGRSAKIVATDVLASNGVIHVIDKVILPTLPQ